MPATMVMLLTEMLNKVVDEVKCSQAKAAVAHHHHHQTYNKILLTEFTDSTTLVLYEKTMFLSCSPVH